MVMLVMSDKARNLSIAIAESRVHVAKLQADPGATRDDIAAAEEHTSTLQGEFRREIGAEPHK